MERKIVDPVMYISQIVKTDCSRLEQVNLLLFTEIWYLKLALKFQLSGRTVVRWVQKF